MRAPKGSKEVYERGGRGPVAWRKTPVDYGATEPMLRPDTRAGDARMDDMGERRPGFLGKDDMPSGEVALVFEGGQIIACTRPRLLSEHEAREYLSQRRRATARERAALAALDRVSAPAHREPMPWVDRPTLAEEGLLPERTATIRARRGA